jgi:hypothetical protein
VPINSEEYHARTFAPGDEQAIISLFNTKYQAFGGFVPRTANYWNWCCLNRPDVDQEGIVIIERNGQMKGYAVVGKSGNIWEFCYNSGDDQETIVSKILTWAENYAQSVGSDSIVLNSYANDAVIRSVCEKMGFNEAPSEPTYLSVLDLPNLIREILSARRIQHESNEEIRFNLKNCPSWCTSDFGIRFSTSGVSVIKYSQQDLAPTLTIQADMSEIVSIIFGNQNVWKAIFQKKVQLGHLTQISKAQKYLKLLQVNSPWFIPRADIA